MSTHEYRIEKDSMGEVRVPKNAYYSAQTQRAVDNFNVSGIRFNRSFIRALGLIKASCAEVNLAQKKLNEPLAKLISEVSMEVANGKWDEHFPLDIFQTGSGTSTNMNANEVISYRANELCKERKLDLQVHPNDHVNFGQSSNDVIPTAIRVAGYLLAVEHTLPKMKILHQALLSKGEELKSVTKTGRTHLMDAMPVTFKQVFGGYARQIELGMERLQSSLERLRELPQGGTAVGTGINTEKGFGKLFAEKLSVLTKQPFVEARDHFEAQSTVDAPLEVSSQLKTICASLMKIANDLRWSNSGPFSGLSDLFLPALQPGSSIMPGKVNPVIEESTIMACAHITGNDLAVTIGAQWGNFELNVMLPLVAHNLLESLFIMGNVCENFAQKSVLHLKANTEGLNHKLMQNPILITALNEKIGYDLGAKIAKTALAQKRPLIDVAKEMTNLSLEELKETLDPLKMT